MRSQVLGFSPQIYARTAGLLYLVVIVAGAFAQLFVRDGLVAANDPATTAHNIMANELLYRGGFVAELIAGISNIPLIVIIYELFKVVNKRLALLVALFSAVGTAIEEVNLLNHIEPLLLLRHPAYLSAIPLEQLQAQAYLSLKVFESGFAISLVFFGWFCIGQGYLIVRSGFMPRFIGVLLAIEGVAYLANSFTVFLAPSLSSYVFTFLAVSVVGELSLCLWLLIKGVNVTKWEARARQADL